MDAPLGARRVHCKSYVVKVADMVEKETACILPGQFAGG
jgi:hypothetical protein